MVSKVKSMLRTKTPLVAVLCAVFSLCPLLYSQANGSLSGTVTDKTGSVVAGGTVKITSQGTGVTREVKTDGSGHYIAPFLPVSIYTIRVESQGFRASEQKDIRLQVDEQREVDFSLNPASVSSTVEVNAVEVAVETTNPTLGQVITAEQVADLPLNGRDFVQLATLTPGVTQETNPFSFFNNGPSSEVSTRGTFSLSVGGSRAQSTDWLFDGVDNNELTAGGIAILPSIDAIQEFKVLTYNYSAEFGTRSGPTVLVTTKSGSNKFHGSLFEFFRNTKLDAKSFFAVSKEKFNLNQFGGALGGALQKDKTFFFVDYQGKRQRHGIPFSGLVPTPAMLTGDYTLDPLGAARPGLFDGSPNANGFPDINSPYTFGPFQCDGSGNPLPAGAGGVQPTGVNCNKIPSNMFDPTVNPSVDPSGLAMMKLYPLSNVVNTQTLTNFSAVPVRSLNEGEFDIRLDHNFSSKDSAFARFSYDQANSFIPGGSPGFAEEDAFGSSQNISNHGRNVAVSETHIFSDRNINQFTAGFNRIFNHILSFGDRTCKSANIGILGANLNSKCPNAPAGVVDQSTKDCISCGLTSTLVGNYWNLGDRGFAPFQGGTNVFFISDSFDMIRGKHDIRIGGGFRANQMNVETNAFQDGFFIPFGLTHDDSADLLLGQMGGGIHDQTFFGATTGRRWKLFRPFVEDTWRVNNDLTLSLGLAWALVTPVSEANNRQANFDFASGKFFVAGSAPITGCTICVRSDSHVGIQWDKTAFEPRIGLAWKPFGSQKTSVRVGYAIFHDSSWNQGGQGLWENPPYLAELDNFFGPCPFNNSGSATPLDCGNQRLFLPTITAPPNPQLYPGALQVQNLGFKQGRVQQFNLNVEHQLPGNVVLTAGYAGSRSSHILAGQVNLNVGSPGACNGGTNGYTLGCGPGGTAFAPKWGAPTFLFPLVMNSNNDVGRAHYDSIQIKAETKSVRHGLYALLGYTYSRTFDSGLPDGLGSQPGATYFPLPGYLKSDWGLSQLNLNHQFTASVTYDLPFGKGKQFGADWNGPVNAVLGNWEVDVIERITSGFPLFVVDSANGSGVNFMWNGNAFNRPDQISDPHKAGIVATNSNVGCHTLVSQGGLAPDRVGTIEAWFNPCAYDHAASGELGNINRAPLYGPDFVNTDLSFIKHFPLPYEGMRLDFRAEFFNAWNHAQFFLNGGGNSHMQDLNIASHFAKVNQTVNNPRVVQLALKLTF
jgi:hypothetical protein